MVPLINTDTTENLLVLHILILQFWSLALKVALLRQTAGLILSTLEYVGISQQQQASRSAKNVSQETFQCL